MFHIELDVETGALFQQFGVLLSKRVFVVCGAELRFPAFFRMPIYGGFIYVFVAKSFGFALQNQ
ncbi:hypothetical protein [Mediterranea massiliensis]|uniref:hypothetical protein n=1 Tax=Mediterranea massiliensis TaxID=1841865 RepID=UPI0025A33EE4|nr:hypothetical protein [Mediterranea massiliensis]MDM8336657.1 hypothetical protein [Mediterranea massiliensis]